MNSNIVTKNATTSEIIWALKSVSSGWSNSSCDDIANPLKAMCPDSQIAKDFKLGRLKLMHIVNYGIAPYYKACVRYFLSNFYFPPYDSPLKTMKKCFLFHLKSSFRSRDIQIFVIFSLPFHIFRIQKDK